MLYGFPLALVFTFALAGKPPQALPSPQTLQAIKQGTVFANSLERTIPNPTDKRSAKKSVYQHFLQGFSDSIAKRLTDYSWDDTTGLPKDHDISLAPPDPSTISILHFKPGKAVISYKTPQELIDTWGFKAYTTETLVFTNGRWIITKSNTYAYRSAVLPLSPRLLR